MAQGQIKKTSKPNARSSTTHDKSTGNTKKGARVLPPRKHILQKRAKLNKKLTAGLTAQTEKMLGEKAGYLEMIGKGRNKNRSDDNTKLEGKGKHVNKKR